MCWVCMFREKNNKVKSGRSFFFMFICFCVLKLLNVFIVNNGYLFRGYIKIVVF